MGEVTDFLSTTHSKLPPGWAWKLFTDVMDIEGGTQPPASEFVDDPRPNYVRLVQIRDFETDAHLTFIPDSKKWRKCSEQDVLIARYGAALGRICRGLAGAYNVALAKVVTTDHVDIDFVYYLLRSHWFQAPLLASGSRSAQAGFNKGTLSVIPLPIPPLEEQRAIASVLGALDAKIEHNRRTEGTLGRLAKAIFRSWFVDFEPVKAKAAGATSFPSMPQPIFDALTAHLVNTALGSVPVGWEVGRLKDLCSINSITVRKDEIHGEIEYVDIASVTVGHLDSVQRMAFCAAPSRARRRVQHGDTIWSCVRPNHRSYLFIHTPPNNRIVSTGFAVLSPTACGPAYLHQLVIQKEFVDYLVANADGSAYPAVRPEHFATAQVAVPPREVLEAFEAITMPVHDLIASNNHESRKLAEMRDYLLPKLLSGVVRVDVGIPHTVAPA